MCSLFYAVQYALFGRLLTAVQSLDVARNRSDEQHDYTPNETANHAAEPVSALISVTGENGHPVSRLIHVGVHVASGIATERRFVLHCCK